MFKVSALIEWEVDDLSGEDEYKFATEELKKILPANVTIKKVKIEKSSKQKRIILGIFSPEDVLPYLTQTDKKKEFSFGGKTYSVKMNSHRYFVFKTNRKCVCCGLDGNKFLLESHQADQSPHFNLYGEYEGDLVLFTKDHIHAKSLGGEDVHSNYQTMCATCNNLKANAVLTIEGIRELRKFYDKIKARKTPKKKMAILIECLRNKLQIKPPKPQVVRKTKSARLPDKINKPVQLKCDMYVYKSGNKLIGKSVYDNDEDLNLFASMKRGSIMRPVGFEEKSLLIPIKDLGEVKIHHNMVDLVNLVDLFRVQEPRPTSIQS